MDEEQLKSLLGDNYEGAKDFFKNQVLGNGEYVNKGKAEAEKSDLQKKLDAANKKIKDSMSADEQKLAEAQAKDDLIASLQEQLKNNSIETSKSKAISGIAEATALVGLKSDDKDFLKFISDISTEDAEKTLGISQYVNKLVKDSYEKGKSEATKQNLGKIGGFKSGGEDNGSDKKSSEEDFAIRIAKQFNPKPTQSSYFKN